MADEYGRHYEWLTFAESEDELRQRLQKSKYVVIYIKEYDFTKWLAKATAAAQEAVDAQAKGEKPKFKPSIWSEIKIHLFELFHGKCAYCESKVLHVSSGDVEHYRPKKRVIEDPSHPGYYWLAYDVSNLLPCCEKCNRVRGKRNHFPVKKHCARCPEDLGKEEPLLLNPYVHTPERHLRFIPGRDNVYYGTVKGITDAGSKSVEIYNLNRAELVERRREKQQLVMMQLGAAIFRGDEDPFGSILSDIRNGVDEYSAAVLSQVVAWWAGLKESADREFRQTGRAQLALIACVSKKNSTPMPARDLYISDWFRKASTYAAHTADKWCILSAKYGLVAPDAVIEPYDETLNKMGAAARRAWARQVVEGLRRVLQPGDHVVILAGNRYRQDLIGPIQQMGCTVEVPMEGLKIGEQLRWLKQRVG